MILVIVLNAFGTNFYSEYSAQTVFMSEKSWQINKLPGKLRWQWLRNKDIVPE